MKFILNNSIRQAVAGLLALLLVFGHDLAAPLQFAGSDDTLWRASDICSVGHDAPAPAERQSSDHDHCVFHCGTTGAVLTPELLTVPIRWTTSHVTAPKTGSDSPSGHPRRTAHSPRAPPFS